MEVFLYSVLVGLLWIASMTILLPFVIFLKFNRKLQKAWFAFVYSKFAMPVVNPEVRSLRKVCLNSLKDVLTSRDVSVSLRVLEIGVGPGHNLKYYPENTSLIALDPNPMFEKVFRKNKAGYPQVRLEKVLQCVAEDMKDVQSGSMDAVVGTYVLCSVDQPEKVLSEIYRVLKPGGHYVFLEHVAYPRKYKRERRVQEFLAPLWSIYSAGCRLCQEPQNLIENAGFSTVTIEQLIPEYVMFVLRPKLLGIVTK